MDSIQYLNDGRFSIHKDIMPELKQFDGFYRNEIDQPFSQVTYKLIEGEKEKNIEEYKLHSKLNSEYIVQLYDYYYKENLKIFYLVQEYCSGGTLRGYIESNTKNNSIQENLGPIQKQNVAVQIVAQILAGYLNLIQNRVVHRNLTPENILNNKGKWKISSFSASRTISDYTQTLNTKTGTQHYESPQQAQKKPAFTSKCDIYAIGVIFYELIYGSFPSSKQSNKRKKNYPFIDDTSHINQDIKKCIIGCLKFKENQRIEWEDLYRHKVFEATLLNTDPKLKEEIQKIEEYLVQICNYQYPLAVPSNILQPILKNKLNVIQTQMRTQNPKKKNWISWTFFYRTIKNKIDKSIPGEKISKMFCLIDKDSKGEIRKSEFNEWISEQKVSYTFHEITKNKILACILTLEKTLDKFQINIQQLFDSYGKANELDFQGFERLIIAIDPSITKDTIVKTFQHLKCNKKQNKIKFLMMQDLLRPNKYADYSFLQSNIENQSSDSENEEQQYNEEDPYDQDNQQNDDDDDEEQNGQQESTQIFFNFLR